MSEFYGRQKELADLERAHEREAASLVVLKGRRRIGKSRLVAEFAKGRKFYVFMGLSPRKGGGAGDQRIEFARQFNKQFDAYIPQTEDWGDLFDELGNKTTHGEVIILLDEISWMASKDPDFLGKLKIAWDLKFSKNRELMLVLCGSVSTWIEKNILSDTGYLGRPSLHITLNELTLSDCSLFWKDKNISPYEKLKLLAVTGGVPRYLELMRPDLEAEENIRSLCFNANGPLFDEFKFIFDDIYGKRSQLYKNIVTHLSKGKSTQEDIANALGLTRGGELSDYLDELSQGGFISRDYTWHPSTGKVSKLSNYRLKDNYVRFYLKFISPNKAKIEKGQFDEATLSHLPGWLSVLGLQFENLVLSNHKAITKALGINTQDIVFDNPYFQRKTKAVEGCQVDYMIQTRLDTVYVCEIKFGRKEIGKEIIEEMKHKINKLKLPKYISRRPVLIHVNGVKDEVLDAQFFTSIINFSDLLK